MRRSIITGVGMYLPDRIVSNDELALLMDTSDAWIRQRTGIEQRRYAPDTMGCAEMGYKASLHALENARITPADIDCIILATLSPDYHFPGSACLVATKLGLHDVPAIDIRAQCSGFIYSLSIADQFIKTGQYTNVLVIGSEKHSMALEFADRGRDVAVLFGDGAGAVVLGPSGDDRGIISTHLHADGAFAEALWLECPGSAHPRWIDHHMIDEGRTFPKMKGKLVYKHALEKIPQVIDEALKANNLRIDDIELFIFHQANLRIIEHVGQQMGIPQERMYNNIQKYGNTTAASIPIALCEAAALGRIKPRQYVLLSSFGSGFTWASALLKW